jgi:hypothetical protein
MGAIAVGERDRDDLESAVPINSMFRQLARFVGLAISGVVAPRCGQTWILAPRSSART